MKTITISAITTKATEAHSKLNKDEDGYYDVILGALNIHNVHGQFYPYTDKVKKLFDKNSSLVRRLESGYLKSETGHPKRMPGQSDRDFLMRNCRLEETLICGHIKQIKLIDTGINDAGSDESIVLIRGKVKPIGPYASTLERDLENGSSNTAFSFRCLTLDKWVGSTLVKELDTIITWDFVNEPGISISNKANSIKLTTESVDYMSMPVDKISDSGLIADIKDMSRVSTESNSKILDDVAASLTACVNGSCLVNHWA